MEAFRDSPSCSVGQRSSLELGGASTGTIRVALRGKHELVRNTDVSKGSCQLACADSYLPIDRHMA